MRFYVEKQDSRMHEFGKVLTLPSPGYDPQDKWVCVDTPTDTESDYLAYQPYFDIPIGSVRFVESILKKFHQIKYLPDYYPQWMRPWWSSPDIYTTDLNSVKLPAFVKPAFRYKAFSGILLDHPSDREFIMQEMIANDEYVDKNPWVYAVPPKHYIEERRWYVANGHVLCGFTYKPESHFGIPSGPIDEAIVKKIPSGWCGTIDMGKDKDGHWSLIECQHPYSCGWYGDRKSRELYREFTIKGWLWLLDQQGKL